MTYHFNIYTPFIACVYVFFSLLQTSKGMGVSIETKTHFEFLSKQFETVTETRTHAHSYGIFRFKSNKL